MLAVMLQRRAQGADDFRGGFEQRLELRLVHATDILAEVVDQVRHLPLEVFAVRGRIGR